MEDKEELVYACTLSSILNHDCAKALELISGFQDVREIFSLSRAELNEILGDHSVCTEQFFDEALLKKNEMEIEWAEDHGIQILFYRDAGYPRKLRHCPDAPIILYYRGNADLNTSRAISIVGSRKATPYGLEYCRRIIEEFSYLQDKPLIISGLAYGIDICAHRCSLEYGLETIAVIATGLDRIYPEPHRKDAINITHKGGILSDLQRGNYPHRLNFIRRNRIIAGLCDACILIESAEKGGGMITAAMAESYDRELFALPGRLCDRYSQGCNYLIKDHKAEIIYSPKSVINSMGWRDFDKKKKKDIKKLILEEDSAIKQKILVILSSYIRMDVDAIIQACRSDIQETLRSLTELELEGRIVKDLCGRYSII